MMERKREKYGEVYDVESFEVPPKVEEWLENGKEKKTLVLTGPTGTGKTEMMKSLLAKKYGRENVLRITNKEGLKRYDESKHKALILDDLAISGEAEDKIA